MSWRISPHGAGPMAADGPAAELSVGIVGLGSRGLSVLERIMTLARRLPGRAIQVEIIDPAPTGRGIHHVDQPDYLLLNTISSQLTMFPPDTAVRSAEGPAAPDLYQWALACDLRITEDGMLTGAAGRPVDPEDHLPRRVLGAYLSWFLQLALRSAPPNVSVHVHQAAAWSLSTEAGDHVIYLTDGRVVRFRYLFLTTGHTSNQTPHWLRHRRSRVISDPYPLPGSLAAVSPGQVLAVAGLGLAAMDVVMAATIGRGGHFDRTGARPRYVPSGAEPRLILYSRSGMPYRARPVPRRCSEPHEALVFTPGELDRCRERAGGMLEFRRHVLPLLVTEIRTAYLCRAAGRRGGAAEAAVRAIVGASLAGGRVDDVLRSLERRYGALDIAEVLQSSAGSAFADAAAYRSYLLYTMGADLAEASRGLDVSPLKAALEVLRDLRDTVRHAVDFGGLTPASHDEFIAEWAPLMNRAVIGPQRERVEDLLALIAEGIVDIPLGPAPRVDPDDDSGGWVLTSTALRSLHIVRADWLCLAVSPQPDVEQSASPLIAAMYGNGRLRRHRPQTRHVRGVDLTPQLHPVDAQGTADLRTWVLGPLCEGTTYYNHYVPSATGSSRAFRDAHRCVEELFASASAFSSGGWTRAEATGVGGVGAVPP